MPRFDWDEPRWRDADDEQQGDVERQRRLRNPGTPIHRGAIDGPSIGETAEDSPIGAAGEGPGPRQKPHDAENGAKG